MGKIYSNMWLYIWYFHMILSETQVRPGLPDCTLINFYMIWPNLFEVFLLNIYLAK